MHTLVLYILIVDSSLICKLEGKLLPTLWVNGDLSSTFFKTL
jgi:hypothetical protein